MKSGGWLTRSRGCPLFWVQIEEEVLRIRDLVVIVVAVVVIVIVVVVTMHDVGRSRRSMEIATLRH